MVRLIALALTAGALACAADVAALVRQVARYEHGGDPAALRDLEAAVAGAAGSPAAAAVERGLLAGLAAARTMAARDAICRNLAVVGTAAAVPALAALLVRSETAEAARYALERIPGEEAGRALRDAFPRAPAAAWPGLVVSLGRRRDPLAVGALRPMLGSPAFVLREAAATALGRIGTSEAREALLAARPAAAVADALLAIAERSAGPEALPVYRRLSDASWPEAARIAALRGAARLDPRGSVAALEAAASSASPALQAAAIRELARIQGAALAGRIPGAPIRTRVRILAALGDTGRAEMRPILIEALSNAEGEVRIAALRGLALLGSPAEVELLARAAARAAGDEQAAARAALAGIPGREADAAILALIGNSDTKVVVEAIRAAGERGIPAAPETLLKTAAGADRKARAESLRALRETARPAHVPAMLALLAKVDDDDERAGLERAIAAAIRRDRSAPVADVIAAWRANPGPETRASLLSILSAAGNRQALPLIREALREPDPEVGRAAVNALAGWPDAEPAPDLLALADTAPDGSRQALALRGYIRLLQLPSARSPAETARLLGGALAAARRPDEKKAALAALQRTVCPESRELVRAALSDAQVASEAKAALETLERTLAERRN